MGRRMAVIAALFALVTTIVACENDLVGLQELGGDYELVAANGQALPLDSFLILSTGGGCVLDLTEGVLAFVDGRFFGSLSYERECPGTTEDGRGFASPEGTYELVGSSIAFTQTGPPLVDLVSGSLEDDGVAVSILWQPNTNVDLRFRKIE